MFISRMPTTRSKRSNSIDEAAPMPNLLTKASLRSLDRPRISAAKISGPVLLSTTNGLQTYNAPDVEAARKLRKVSSVSSDSSRNSDQQSDASSTSPRSRGTSVTDSSSIGSSPSSPMPNEGKSYFVNSTKSSPPPPRRAASTADLKRRALSFEQSPNLPQRAPTHSKVAHETLARKRSLQTMKTWQEPARSVPAPAVEPVREQRTSRDIFNHKFEGGNHHPFGKELEQLDEIAEEFGGAVRDAEREADDKYMRQMKLRKFTAADYMLDIEPIFSRIFVSRPAVRASVKPEGSWI